MFDVYRYLSADLAWSDRLIFTVLTYLTTEITVYACNLALYVIYHFGLFARYKIQAADKWPERQLVWRALLNDVASKGVVAPIALYVLYPYLVLPGAVSCDGDAPGWPVFAVKFVCMWAINDVLFYWSHRALHWPPLYKRIHKRHHEFKQTIGISYAYAHTVEDIVSNMVPLFVALNVVHMHLAHWLLFLSLRLWETIDAHSGYDLPFSPWRVAFGGPRAHDYHHSHNSGNFGILEFWDQLCGTDRAYRDFCAKQALPTPTHKSKHT